MLTIVFDFDGTFDLLPLASTLAYIAALKSTGHRVLIVSSRHCSCDADGKCENHIELASASGCSVILTSGAAKKWFLEQRKIKVDVWIDDQPESIINGK